LRDNLLPTPQYHAPAADNRMYKTQIRITILVFMLVVPTLSMASNVVGETLLGRDTAMPLSSDDVNSASQKVSPAFPTNFIPNANNSYLDTRITSHDQITLHPNTDLPAENYSQNAKIGSPNKDQCVQNATKGITYSNVFLLNTPISADDIRSTECSIEEPQFDILLELAAELGDGELNNAATDKKSESECEPVGKISEGLYIALFDGKLNAASKKGDIDMVAPAAARIERGDPECLTEIPNFLALDPYLSEDPEYSVSEYEKIMGTKDMFKRVERLLQYGYSADAIYSHEISKGLNIVSIVDAASLSEPSRETEFRWLADLLLPGYPGTACGCNDFRKDRNWNEIAYDSLEPKTIEQVARVYFDNGQHLSRFSEKSAHGLFPVKELAQLLRESSLTYRILPVRNHPIPAGVFVSIYKDNEEIVVDGNLGAVQAAVARGDEFIPVIFHYYWDGIVPIGRFPEVLTSGDVSGILDDLGTILSPVPNWRAGDYHAWILIEEVEDLVNIPEKDDIDPELWDRIEIDLKTNGFAFPVLMTPGEGIANYQLYNSVERVAVAKHMGKLRVPVVMLEPPHRPDQISLCRKLVRQDHRDGYGQAGSYGFFGGGSGGPPLLDDPPPPPPPPPVVPPPPVTP